MGGRAGWPLWAKRIALSLASFLVFCGVCEVLIRVLFASNLPIQMDDLLGWRATSNYRSLSLTREPVTTGSDGFRAFGDVASKRPKVLFVGDSFTAALAVGNGRTYFDVAGRALDVEVFAYGAIGYGTLQEAMILERFAPEIHPDLIVWQYCWNDFVNNSLELETTSLESNSQLRRPYLEGDAVIYAVPSRYPRLRLFALDHSRLLYFAMTRIDMAAARREGVDKEIERGGLAYPPFVRAREATARALARGRRAAEDAAMVAFSVERDEPFQTAFRELSAGAGIRFTTAPVDTVDGAEATHETVRMGDGHWNELGHRLAGEALAGFLRGVGLPKRGPATLRASPPLPPSP
jgi:hypothetical protein